MKKLLAVIVMMTAMSVAAQQTTPQTPPAGETGVQTGQGGKAQQQTPRGKGMAHPHQHPQGMQPGGMQEMKGMHGDMAAHIERMQRTLEQMRTTIAQVKDPATRQALEQSAEMWSQMVEHMQQMHEQRGAGGPGGEGMAMGQGMGGSGGMACGKPGCCEAHEKKKSEQPTQ